MKGKSGFGVGLSVDWHSAEFTIFSLAFHAHLPNDPRPCPFRGGVEATLFGIGLSVGYFSAKSVNL